MNRHWTGHIGVVLAALASLGGLAVSGVLLQHHVVVEVGGDPVFNAVCEVTEHSSCDEVLASEWGRFPFGAQDDELSLPTAMLGLVFFAAMTSWFIVIGRASGSRRWLHIAPVLAAAGGTAACAFLDYVMFAKLDSWCPFCFAAHILTGLLLIVTLLTWPRRDQVTGVDCTGTEACVASAGVPAAPRAASHPPLRPILITILLAGVISAAAWSEFRHRIALAYAGEYYARWQEFEKDYRAAYERFLSQEQVEVPIGPADPVRGPADAPHTVVVFTDFQCPYCRGLEHMLDERLKEFPGRFRLVYKYFPMNRLCNKHIKSTLHRASCATARVAEVARIVGGNDAFWEMHDALFQDPKAFSEKFVKEVAGRIGVDNKEFWGQFRRSSSWNQIYEHVEQGKALGVKATPTLFFDGRRLTKWGDKHTWQYLLEVVEGQDPKPRPATTRPGTQPASQPAGAGPRN